MDDKDAPVPRHDPAGRRFILLQDGHAASLEYGLAPGRLAILHTRVPPEIGGRGIAAALVRAAVDFARAEGLQVEPRCEYAAAWFARHPDLAWLLA